MPDGDRITVSDWHKRMRAGSDPLHRELLDGEIVVKAPVSRAHAECVVRLHDLIEVAVGDSVLTQMHLPVILDEWSEPTPDISVLGRTGDGGDRRPPLLLVVEVADTSERLVYGRGRKAAYYARSGVPDCWVVDLLTPQLLAHSSPASGGYRSIRNLRAGSTATATSLPGLSLEVDGILSAERG
jgi:Uma2 family endonuclease